MVMKSDDHLKKILVLFYFLIMIFLVTEIRQAIAGDHFQLTPSQIKKAMELGKNSELRFNEFGDYDIGLNRFEFKQGIGYVVIFTPFVEIATVAKLKTISQEDFKYGDAEKLTNYPPNIRIYLQTTKKNLRSPVDCLLITSSEIIVLRSRIKETSQCHGSMNECLRKLVFTLPMDTLKNVAEFTVLLSNKEFAQSKIKIPIRSLY